MIGQIVAIIVAGLVIAGLIAPREALSWWRRGEMDEPTIRWPSLDEAFGHPGDQPDDAVPAALPAEQGHYLVYLSGLGISGPDELPVVEIPLVERVAERIGRTRVIWQIYPYSVANTALTQGRRFSRVWQALARWKFEKNRLRALAFGINLRNAFQMFVSSDRRYGPVFNLAIADQIAAALIRNGYAPEHRRPVTLLGWSGGAQIAAGAAWYLAALGIPVRVMSMAGILSADPGLDRAQQIWHLRGDTDKVQSLGVLFFARRWPVFRDSPWNRARRDGRLEIIRIGPLKHAGKGGYFSAAPLLPDGREPREATVDQIVRVLVEAGLATDRAAPERG
ncbi:hypothetical protein brsh051_14340 [Brooklawnia propionicigenes]|uniref:Alpha/beta hydrolase n=1 Tax=Brooklawnia propionicigenes TaxID=3041175 RepID=A0AAN0KFW8_9ACTN|nr:hypothetical protein [Brooklawnia sp. SH051]BEH02153.1 hypothetical protein brsh051_14340 [Brooklawnia sp. SH051]